MALTSHSGIVGCAVRTISRFTSSKSCWDNYQAIQRLVGRRLIGHGLICHRLIDQGRSAICRLGIQQGEIGMQNMSGQKQNTEYQHASINRSLHQSMQQNRPLLAMFCFVLLLAVHIMGSKAMAADEVYPPGGTHDGVKVEQPIEFPHDIHVKVNKINCMYCHTYARRSKVAGIPPTSKCIGCHKVIATDKPRIQKLTQYWESKEPPGWKKVHDVPDFVHFTHEKHLKKFVFDRDFPVENVKEVCAFCHGQIENMTVANKVKPLNMGWCKNCHEANGGPGDCWKCHK